MTDQIRGGGGGGSATAAGIDYQAAVTAWYCVAVLAEQDCSPPLDLPASASLELVRAETGQPVDDLLVGTSERGWLFAQVKHSLSVSESEDSGLASALGQFVRQYWTNCTQTGGAPPSPPWGRPLEPDRDRLVLVASSLSSLPFRSTLPEVLKKVRACARPGLPDDATLNDEERRVLAVANGHISNAWRSAVGNNPTTDDICTLLGLIRVQILDVDPGGADETTALDRLRTAILRDPSQDAAAWQVLVRLAARLAADQTGVDRHLLQGELLGAGFDLRAPRSYREDIERLRAHSKTSRGLLSDLAAIHVGTAEVKIVRECQQDLLTSAEGGSLLITGEPGAGKSGVIHSMVSALDERGRNSIVLLVDRLSAESLGGLRMELGLQHEISDVLREWPAREPNFLIIDALDAARGDWAARAVRDLIAIGMRLGNRWHVVASVRKFDLRYGLELQRHFAGSPPSQYMDPEFSSVRHVNVPRLSDGELDQIGAQSPELRDLLARAPRELRQLLLVPFNIRLIADLLTGGVDPSQLTPIRTQLELLDRYWGHRVLGDDGHGDEREGLLRDICSKMVARRSLRLDRAAIDANRSAFLSGLLSTFVLTEWQASADAPANRYILSFAHNVLYDYAVSRLMLRGPPERLHGELARDEEFALVARPSIGLHFRHLWGSFRDDFWTLTFALVAAPAVGKIACLVGPSVISDEARSANDLEPLHVALEGGAGVDPEVAAEVLEHVVGALLADQGPIVGPDAGPWCSVAKRLGRSISRRTAFPLRSLVWEAVEGIRGATSDQLDCLGAASRALLGFVWERMPDDRQLAGAAIRGVCQTFHTDPEESAKLLKRFATPTHLADRGHVELHWLAREVPSLPSDAADLVAQIYVAAFSIDNQSDEQTPLNSSRILPLTSSRSQDYGMGLWGLAETYGAFLKKCPVEATHALTSVVGLYVDARRLARGGSHPDVITFEFISRTARITPDFSGIWDAGSLHDHDEPIRMLNVFEGHLKELSRTNARSTIDAIVDQCVESASSAVLWRRVLRAAAESDGPLFVSVTPLLWSSAILRGLDTSVEAGEVLKRHFSKLDEEARKKVEDAILMLAREPGEAHAEAAEKAEARLLGCLDHGSIVRDATRERLSALQQAIGIPANEPMVRFSSTKHTRYEEEDYLADAGVSLDEPANRSLFELTRPVREFSTMFVNSVPEAKDAADISGALGALHDALCTDVYVRAHESLRDSAWGHLAAAGSRLARCPSITCGDAHGARVRQILVDAAKQVQPKPDAEENARFDESPSWSSPAARIDAAEGILTLAQRSDCVSLELTTALKRLVADDATAVRFQVARHLPRLLRSTPDVAWSCAETMSGSEESRMVLMVLVNSTISRLASLDPERGFRLVESIRSRTGHDTSAAELRAALHSVLVGLHVYRNHEGASAAVSSLISDIRRSPECAQQLVNPLRDALTYGNGAGSAGDVRARSLAVLTRLTRGATSVLEDLDKVPFARWTEEEKACARGVAGILDKVSAEAYFGSGAYDLRGQAGDSLPARTARFYEEASELFDEITKVRLPSAAHRVVETLEVFIKKDPRGVFLRIAEVVRQSQVAGYHLESLAADAIVRIVERYLAEYRPMLRHDEPCRRALQDVLESFVAAGWPNARRLTYRLEEIFR